MFLALPEKAPAGTRLAVKDLFDTAGLVTTYGSPLFAGHVPATTARVVALEAAGYGNVGKTNLHEFAYGTTSENPHFGVVPNPLAPDRVAGGSSGGNAAALVLEAADVALGTDSGGSIRIPAACCGVVGFKPSYGLVSLEGCFPLAPSFDHAGPMARDVATCEAALAVLAPDTSRSGSSRSKTRDRHRVGRRRRAARSCSRARSSRPRTPAPLRGTPATRRSPSAVRPRGGRRAPRAHRGKRRALRRGRALQDRALPGSVRAGRRARGAAARSIETTSRARSPGSTSSSRRRHLGSRRGSARERPATST